MNSASHKRKFDPEFAAAEQAEKAANKAAKEIDAESFAAAEQAEKAAKKAAKEIDAESDKAGVAQRKRLKHFKRTVWSVDSQRKRFKVAIFHCLRCESVSVSASASLIACVVNLFLFLFMFRINRPQFFGHL